MPTRLAVGMRSALLLTYALSLYGALVGLPGQPEHEIHLFCSSHYQGHYFDLWDSRWYGGFAITGHPPLAHELVSLVARLPYLGGERTYALMIVAVAVAFVFSAARLMQSLGGDSVATKAAFLLATYPYLYLFLFPLGQLPFILGVALALGAAAAFLEAEREGEGAFHAISVCLGAAALATHPAALLALFAGAAVAAVVASRSASSKATRVWLHAGLNLGGAALIAGGAIWPFWRELLAGHLRATAPDAWPIPSDKLLCISGLAVIFALASCDLSKVGWGRFAGIGFVAILVMACAAILGSPGTRALGERRQAMREVSAFLSGAGNERWRYMTLGLGNDRLELGRRSLVGSIDGSMPWIAPIEELKETPFFSLDELPLNDAQSSAILSRVLRRAEQLHVRWIISANDRAFPILASNGFVARSAWKGSMVLWENGGSSPVPASVTARTGLQAIAWGVIPPGLIAVALGLWLWKRPWRWGRAPGPTGASPGHPDLKLSTSRIR